MLTLNRQLVSCSWILMALLLYPGKILLTLCNYLNSIHHVHLVGSNQLLSLVTNYESQVMYFNTS